MRIIGDTIFLFGVAAFTYFMAGAVLRLSYERTGASVVAPVGARPRPI